MRRIVFIERILQPDVAPVSLFLVNEEAATEIGNEIVADIVNLHRELTRDLH